MKFFGQVDASIQFGNGTMINIDESEGEKSKSTTYVSSIQPGIAFFPTKRIAIELKVPLFSYFNQKIDYKEPGLTDARYAQFGFGSDLNKPVLGINFHF